MGEGYKRNEGDEKWSWKEVEVMRGRVDEKGYL